MKTKPITCQGCPLHTKGTGFGEAVGPKDAEILFVGEALGAQEASTGEPFVGPAGMVFNKILRSISLDRSKVRVHNIINCQPPNNWLVGSPWEYQAIEHCSQYIKQTIEEGSQKVVVGLGAVASKVLSNLYGIKGVSIYDLHGAPPGS